MTARAAPGVPAVPPVTLSWRPQLADISEIIALRGRVRRARLRMLLSALVFALVGLFGLLAHTPFLAGVAFTGIFIIVSLLVQQPYRLRRAYRQAEALHQPRQVHLSGAGIESRSSLATAQYPWTSIESALEGDRVYVLQIRGARLAFLSLAKRGAADPAAAAALHAWIAPYLTKPR